MKLSELFAGLVELPAASSAADLEITSIAHDSRQVEPGALFVTWKGERFDGASFALEAEARGALAVIGQGRAPEGLGLQFIRTAEPRRLLGKLSARHARHPDRELELIGVTGTNGKGTVVSIVASILEAAGRPCGRFGTHGNRFGEVELGGGRTTAEAPELFAGLREVRRQGGDVVAMEVSSHALSLQRVDELRFDVAVFTNLTRDHLDFHGDEASYWAAKRRLFDLRKSGGKAVVFIDDVRGRELAEELGEDVLTVGCDAQVRPEGVELTSRGLRAVVRTPRGELRLRSPLLGGFNLSNVLVAIGVAEALELPPRAIEEGVANTRALPGRMERIDPDDELPVVVDYAHTPAALEAALLGMREIGSEHLIAVFGCGGDRDRGKREPMGQIAGRLAELPIATSDNPRNEDPLDILAEVEAGLRSSGNETYRVVPDRREAIRRAIAIAGPSSAVLIAGKGHEVQQITGRERRHFSDREEALAALERRRGSVARG